MLHKGTPRKENHFPNTNTNRHYRTWLELQGWVGASEFITMGVGQSLFMQVPKDIAWYLWRRGLPVVQRKGNSEQRRQVSESKERVTK